MRARMETLRTFGPALSLSIPGCCAGAGDASRQDGRPLHEHARGGEVPADHPKVSWVNYPGLPDNKYHKLAQKYLPKGASGLLNFA